MLCIIVHNLSFSYFSSSRLAIIIAIKTFNDHDAVKKFPDKLHERFHNQYFPSLLILAILSCDNEA